MPKKDLIPTLYEDDYLIAIQKPPRVVSVPNPQTSLNASVLGKVQRRYEGKGFKPYLLHRLDKETSGVLLFGKFERDRTPLEAIFQHSETEKSYLTFLKGVPRGDSVQIPLKARTADVSVEAKTHFSILKTMRIFGASCALVEAVIETGRRHQIREHFSRIGCPVIMDAEYGDFAFNRKFRIVLRLGRLFLHAKRIRFMHPFLKQLITIEAPIPMDLLSVLKKVFGSSFSFKIKN
ncbi:RluA family pseudouridine synthase [Candidatus Peregrinibacteria bacterium]|nr:RluA family pseudouridine synthase [Candidatus Peregrinibacteria bacterium]